jgi:hypothetical protein
MDPICTFRNGNTKHDEKYGRLMNNLERYSEDKMTMCGGLRVNHKIYFVNVREDIHIYGAWLRSVTDKMVSFYVFDDHWELARVHALLRERCDRERKVHRYDGYFYFKAVSPIKRDSDGAYIQFKRKHPVSEYPKGTSRRRYDLNIDVRGIYINEETKEIGVSWDVDSRYYDDGPPAPKIAAQPSSSGKEKPPFLMLPTQPKKPSSKEKKPPFLMLPGSSTSSNEPQNPPETSSSTFPFKTTMLISEQAIQNPTPTPPITEPKKEPQERIQRARHPLTQVPENIRRPKKMQS